MRLALLNSADASAQTTTLSAGLGVALPAGAQADRRDAGMSASVGIGHAISEHWDVRADAEYMRLASSGLNETMQGIGITASAVLYFTRTGLQTYLLAGAGGYRLDISGRRNVYGTTAAVHAGLGFQHRVRGAMSLYAEGRYVVHMTDYGSGEFSLTLHAPLNVGVNGIFDDAPYNRFAALLARRRTLAGAAQRHRVSRVHAR